MIARANLIFRFLLEMTAFIAGGYWGYGLAEGLWGGTLALLIPLGMALVWGFFAVPNDPSRGAVNVPAPVPGWLRLLIEILFFGFGVWCVFAVGLRLWGWLFAAGLLLHYGLAYPRLLWLLKQK
jgi:hypothetical protein